MLAISTADLERDFDRYIETASREPVLVTLDDGATLVMVPADEYRRLKTLNGETFATGDSDES